MGFGQSGVRGLLHIELKELQLQPRTRYYYRVKIWDQHHRPTEWSEAAWWEMGLLSPEEWARRMDYGSLGLPCGRG